jgi:hypothetical protein
MNEWMNYKSINKLVTHLINEIIHQSINNKLISDEYNIICIWTNERHGWNKCQQKASELLYNRKKEK